MQFINFILKQAFIQSVINRSKVDFSKTFNFYNHLLMKVLCKVFIKTESYQSATAKYFFS